MVHRLGLIHGRFQVLHKDHLTYLLTGKERCDHLIIGITNPTEEATKDEPTNPERSDPFNNPLTYEERKAMIRAAFKEARVSADAFSVIPFPISDTAKLEEHAPREAVYFLTIYDEWGREKLGRLQALGLQTEVMWEKSLNEKGISGTNVRNAIRTGQPWEHLVPPAVASLAKEWGIQERLNGSSGS